MENDRDHDTMMSDFYATVQNQAERIAQQLAEQPQQLAEQPTPPWAPVPLQRPRTLPQGAGPPVISPAALSRAAARRRGEPGPSVRSDPAALIRIARGHGRLPRAGNGGVPEPEPAPAPVDYAEIGNDSEAAEPSAPPAPRTIPEVCKAPSLSATLTCLSSRSHWALLLPVHHSTSRLCAAPRPPAHLSVSVSLCFPPSLSPPPSLYPCI